MFRGSGRLLVAAVTVGMMLAVPATALAGSSGTCHASACKVYIEPGVPNGTGSFGASGTNGGSTAAANSGGSASTNPPPVSSTLPVPSETSHALDRAGVDKHALSNLVENPAFGVSHGLEPSTGYGNVRAPGALGTASGLGAGPTALLATLAGIAVLVLAAAGLAGRRRRRRSS
jgi:hypothetical protein